MRTIITTLTLLLLAAPLSAYAAAVSPLASLSDAEQSYYEKVFDYTMDVVKPGTKYEWASYSGNGTINVEAPFISKSGVPCRNFDENFVVQGVNGADKGVACKRQGSDGWCKLRIGNAMTCAMEDPSFMFGGVNVSGPNISTGSVNMTVPAVNAPGGSSGSNGVNTNIDTPRTGKVTSKDIAGGVTGSAGKAAGSVTGGALNWFSGTFR